MTAPTYTAEQEQLLFDMGFERVLGVQQRHTGWRLEQRFIYLPTKYWPEHFQAKVWPSSGVVAPDHTGGTAHPFTDIVSAATWLILQDVPE